MADTKVLNAFLCLLVAFGLVIGLLHSVNLKLDSDTVVPGIIAMEVVNYHDFQFIYPANDPYLFTDIFTFHFLPQVLSGYDPMVLRLTAYGVFLLITGVFSYLVYRFSGLTSALIFAALLTTLNPDAYWLFISPNYHAGTLLFAGIFLLLGSPDLVKNLRLPVVIALAFVAGLIVISDSIILILFIIPYIVYSVYRYRIKSSGSEAAGSKKERDRRPSEKKNEVEHMDAVLLLLIVFAALAYLLKRHNLFLGWQVLLVTPISIASNPISNLALFWNALILLVNGNLYHLLNSGVTLYDLAIATIFLGVVAYSLIFFNKKASYLYSMFLLAAAGMFLAFVSTTLAVDIRSARFLLYFAVSIFAVIALAYRPEKLGLNFNTLFLAAILLLIIVSIFANAARISGYDYQPNKDDIALAGYLEQQNLTHGYADYNTGNKLIYFSKEKLLYPKVQINGSEFGSDGMCTSDRWYKVVGLGDRYCYLVVNPSDTGYPAEQKYVTTHAPLETYTYQNYSIYKYEIANITYSQS